MNTSPRERAYPVELVLKGLDTLINEFSAWYSNSELDDDMSRELFLMASEKVDPGAIVNKSLIEESIANEKTGRVFCYIDRIGHLRMLRNVFEGARSLEDIPKSIKDSVHEIFTGVIVRKVAIIFPSPINPQATSLIDARKNIASIYQYVGALSALRPPTMPIGMTFPFDF